MGKKRGKNRRASSKQRNNSTKFKEFNEENLAEYETNGKYDLYFQNESLYWIFNIFFNLWTVIIVNNSLILIFSIFVKAF